MVKQLFCDIGSAAATECQEYGTVGGLYRTLLFLGLNMPTGQHEADTGGRSP